MKTQFHPPADSIRLANALAASLARSGTLWTALGRAARLLPLLLLLTLPAVVQAQFNYTINNGTITITRYTGPGGAVTIPSTINGLPVTSIAYYAFQSTDLTSVTIPNSVTIIGISAFQGCISLSSVTIPNSVTSIGESAFNSCYRLTNVTIGNGVTSIGDYAFAGCHRLTTITVDALNSAYTSVDGVVFNKSQTTLIQYPGGKARSYTIPTSVTFIGDRAFPFTSLTSVMIGDSVTSIGICAFQGCSSLTNVAIGNSVTNIGYSAFSDCTSLTTFTIPNSVTTIRGGAFDGCTSLTSVTIPNSVTTIGGRAFLSCTSLIGVTIPNSVTSIGEVAFYDCTSLTSVTMGNSVSSIGAGAFAGCISLTSVSIPSSVNSIGNSAPISFGTFLNCTSLTSVTFGNGVTNIGHNTFEGCSSLTGVYFQGNAPSVGSSVFNGANNATVNYLPGTTGWSSTFGGRPTALWVLPYPLILNHGPGFGVQTDGFGFIISWATNLPVVVEASPDLRNPVWTPVSTNTLTDGSSYFSDPQLTNHPIRFYRVISPVP